MGTSKLTGKPHLCPEMNALALFHSTSCATGLLDIFIYFIFDIIMCVLVEFH